MTRLMENAKLITDYGVKGILLVAIFWMNTRLGTVEDKLYNCFEQRITESRSNRQVSQRAIQMRRVVATLPEEISIIWRRS